MIVRANRRSGHVARHMRVDTEMHPPHYRRAQHQSFAAQTEGDNASCVDNQFGQLFDRAPVNCRQSALKINAAIAPLGLASSAMLP